MKNLLIFIFVCGFSMTSWAHGDHGGPTVQPQKGGILKSLETVHVELVQIDKTIRIYVFSKELKLENPEKYKITAKAILPRGKGEKKLSLKNQKKYLTANFNTKGLHRYNVVVFITQGGHDDRVVFTVEPKN